jgi:voltage-gated potassium channel
MKFRKRVAEILEQGRYNDRTSRIVNLLLITLILLNVVAIMFESVDSIHQKYRSVFNLFEFISVAIFTIEYLARVWSSVDLGDSDHRSPIIGRIRFMLHPLTLIDLIAILPFYLNLYMEIDFRVLRILRLLRLFKLTRYSPALSVLLEVLYSESRTLLAAFVVMLIMLVLSATGIHYLEGDIQPEAFGSIPEAMWWSIVTLTTVGYGDVVPVTTAGKFFAGIISLLGIGMVAIPAAIMASGFTENLRERREKYNATIRKVLKDGLLDDRDRWRLEQLRKELGLTSTESLMLLEDMLAQAQKNQAEVCPHCGKPLDEIAESTEPID